MIKMPKQKNYLVGSTIIRANASSEPPTLKRAGALKTWLEQNTPLTKWVKRNDQLDVPTALEEHRKFGEEERIIQEEKKKKREEKTLNKIKRRKTMPGYQEKVEENEMRLNQTVANVKFETKKKVKIRNIKNR